MLTRQLTLKASGRKPPDLGPRVRTEAAHLTPAGSEAGLQTLIGGAGLRDWDRDGLLEQDTSASHMWRGACVTNLALEFELPEPVALGAIEVWNYNAQWQTRDGVRKADVAVSPDGTTWETVLRGAEFAEAQGDEDYDEPIQLKLKGATVRKVRLENIVPWNAKGNVGLSKVVFHQAMGAQAGPRMPEDGALGVGIRKPVLDWVAGQGATEHRVYLGKSPDSLALIGTTKTTRLDAPELKPDSTYFWRVDEAQTDGRVATGRVARFETSGLVAWWKLDETKGAKAEDATGHEFTGNVTGRAKWAADQGRIGGALDFDGSTTVINCGNGPQFDFREGMTVAAWIKVREFDTIWQPIVTKGYHAWRLQRQENAAMITFCFNTDSPLDSSGTNQVNLVSKRKVDDGQWHHVAGVFDGRRSALYLDGEVEDSADAKPIAPTSSPVMIGGNSGRPERKFNGWMSDVRLYGYGLSEAEVKALYRGGGDTSRAKK